MNLVRQLSSREQSQSIEQLLSGPVVGSADGVTGASGEADRDGGVDRGGPLEGQEGDDPRGVQDVSASTSTSVAAISFAHIAHMDNNYYPSLGAAPKPRPANASHPLRPTPSPASLSSAAVVWGRGLTPVPATTLSVSVEAARDSP